MQNKAFTSLYGQMVYVFFSGLQLLFVPNMLLKTFGFEPTSEIWIRVLGMLVLVLTIYYYAIYKYGNREIVQATVVGRLLFCGGLVFFVLFGMAKPMLLAFAAAETALVAWTWTELRMK